MSHAPDLIEKVVGFRAWSLGRAAVCGVGRVADDQLWSVGNHPVRWESARMTARCLKEVYGLGGVDHPGSPPPHVDCKCGIYAKHQLGWPSSTPEGVCVGAVAAWGRIQVHRHGFRAERAEIIAFGYLSTWGRAALNRLRGMATRLGVQMVPLADLHTVALEYGSPVPRALLPKAEHLPRPVTGDED